MKCPALFVIFLLFLGCNNSREKKFDRKKWLYKEDWDYPYRDEMVSDLIAHHKIKRLKFNQLVDSLGEPQYDDIEKCYFYSTLEDYGSDIDPVHTKSLMIYVNRDSVVTGFKLYEWKKPD